MYYLKSCNKQKLYFYKNNLMLYVKYYLEYYYTQPKNKSLLDIQLIVILQ